jgi:hypothetical protein
VVVLLFVSAQQGIQGKAASNLWFFWFEEVPI